MQSALTNPVKAGSVLIRLLLVALIGAQIFVTQPGQSFAAEEQAAKIMGASSTVPLVSANLANITLEVGSGKTYSTLQAAFDAIPATPTSNYYVKIHPGTYTTGAVLSGKNTGTNGAAIVIENATSTKPLFLGGLTKGNNAWSSVPGYDEMYSTAAGGAVAVTDNTERLKQVAGLAELSRATNAWYSNGSTVYVRLVDLASPNTRSLTVTTVEQGLRISGVANVLIQGLRFEHFGRNGVVVENAGSTSVRSVWTEDIGRRGADDAGVLITGSPSSSVINSVSHSVFGAAIRIKNSSGVQAYNNTAHRVTQGIDLENSPNAFLQNNVFGSAMENPLEIDSPSVAGLSTTKNVYFNPSGAAGEINGTTYTSTSSLGAAAGGETGSSESDPRFRSTTTAWPDEVNFLHNTMHDLDAGLFGGQGWASNTDAAKLRWDEGFMLDAYIKMYRATRDLRWLEKIVTQSDTVWAQAYENPASPGTSPDGYLGWSTSRYSVALGIPSTVTATGGELRLVDSNGTVLQPPSEKLRVYGPGNGDTIPNKTLELRFGLNPDVRYEVWDVTGTATCIGNCGLSDNNYDDGVKDVTISDGTVNSAASYTVRWQVTGVPPQVGDVYRIQLKAKKQLEYHNVDGGLTAPMIDFAVEVLQDPTIQNEPVASSTYLAKANDYINKVSTNIFPKWEPYFKDLATSPGSFGAPGGVYVYPCDEQYSIPCNTLPMNMLGDMGRLWTYMYQATGGAQYKARAESLANFVKGNLETRIASSGAEFYYWDYFNQSGTWDTWTAIIPEDVNHGGLVADFAQVARGANIVFSDLDLKRFRTTFTDVFWKPQTSQIYWFVDKTTPLSYASTIYYFHSWMDLPGGEPVAQLAHDVYANNGYNTVTGVIYQMMADAALQLSRETGAENFRLRPGSPAIRSGNNTAYDVDYDGRSRSVLGQFDRGAFSFIPLERLFGSNRYTTAKAISADMYPQGAQADAVVLARGDVFADGLAGAPFAAQENAPILLTRSTDLPPEVLTEIKRILRPGGKVWVLGGSAAVSDGVLATLTNEGYVSERIAGSDRYDTAARISYKLKNLTEVFIANGTSFADPLAASAVAASRGAAIVLAKTDSLTTPTADFLKNTPATNLHVVGGTSVVSSAVFNEAKKYGSVDRFAGSNRYSTATTLANYFFPGPGTVTFATGTNFPDALVAGRHAGSPQVLGPIILVKPTEVPAEVKTYLSNNLSSIMNGFVYGGAAAVSDAVKNQLESLL